MNGGQTVIRVLLILIAVCVGIFALTVIVTMWPWIGGVIMLVGGITLLGSLIVTYCFPHLKERFRRWALIAFIIMVAVLLIGLGIWLIFLGFTLPQPSPPLEGWS